MTRPAVRRKVMVSYEVRHLARKEVSFVGFEQEFLTERRSTKSHERTRNIRGAFSCNLVDRFRPGGPNYVERNCDFTGRFIEAEARSD